MADEHPRLWTPDAARIAGTRLHDYMQWLTKRGLRFSDCGALHQGSGRTRNAGRGVV